MVSTFEVLPAAGPRRPVVAHVPHSSSRIPDEFRGQILLDHAALARELVRMTDWHTDGLFESLRELGAQMFVNRLSRLVVDPERFPDDDDEPSARYGQGAVYTHTSDGAELRRPSPAERQAMIDGIYVPYHAALTDLVTDVVGDFGECLIVDCHSFGSVPLPSEPDQAADRPDICVGTDAFHTPAALAARFEAAFTAQGFRVKRDSPFSGALVPLRYYGTDARVTAVMVEVNRRLYCDESSGEPLPGFAAVGAAVGRAIATALG